MQIKAKLKYLRISPRKARLVADMIRRKKVEEAQNILNFTVKGAAKPILKLLNSAVASAKNNLQLDSENLYISKITVDEGPKYKRWMPRARGQVSEIQKKTSHITIFLDEVAGAKKRKVSKKVKKAEKPEKKPSVVKEMKEKEALIKEEKVSEKEKFKKKPERELEKPKPKITKGIRRFFRRKAI